MRLPRGRTREPRAGSLEKGKPVEVVRRPGRRAPRSVFARGISTHCGQVYRKREVCSYRTRPQNILLYISHIICIYSYTPCSHSLTATAHCHFTYTSTSACSSRRQQRFRVDYRKVEATAPRRFEACPAGDTTAVWNFPRNISLVNISRSICGKQRKAPACQRQTGCSPGV